MMEEILSRIYDLIHIASRAKKNSVNVSIPNDCLDGVLFDLYNCHYHIKVAGYDEALQEVFLTISWEEDYE